MIMNHRVWIVALIASAVLLLAVFMSPAAILDGFARLPLTFLFMLISVGSLILAIFRRHIASLRIPIVLLAGGSAVLAWSLFGRPWPGNATLSLLGLLLTTGSAVTYLRSAARGERRPGE